jgi:CheY-like chemotaxis protein
VNLEKEADSFSIYQTKIYSDMIEEKTKTPMKSQFKILFVDDEENARKYFEKGLKHNFNVMVASNVDEAQKLITENHKEIAVVITDQRMPGGNGVKLLRFLREQYPRIIRLLTTAYSDLTEAIDAVNSGEIFRYIQKPWDFNMLKIELEQALELFELRMERGKFLHEKITVKRKMTKTDRAKSLLFFAKTLNAIRFSENSAQNFIKNFATGNVEISDNWEDLDFGKNDVLEAKFFLELIEKIQKEISNSADYKFNDNIDGSKIGDLIEKEKNNLNLKLQASVSNHLQGKINQQSFETIIKKLLEILSAMKAQSCFMSIDKVDHDIVINLKADKIILPENSNIFMANPQKPLSDFYVDLLICYLLVGHHGGSLEVKIEDHDFNCRVKIPTNPESAMIVSSPDSLENAILATMIS